MDSSNDLLHKRKKTEKIVSPSDIPPGDVNQHNSPKCWLLCFDWVYRQCLYPAFNHNGNWQG